MVYSVTVAPIGTERFRNSGASTSERDIGMEIQGCANFMRHLDFVLSADLLSLRSARHFSLL